MKEPQPRSEGGGRGPGCHGCACPSVQPASSHTSTLPSSALAGSEVLWSFGETLEGWKEPQLVFAHPFLEPSTSDHPWGSPKVLQVPLSKDEDLPA